MQNELFERAKRFQENNPIVSFADLKNNNLCDQQFLDPVWKISSQKNGESAFSNNLLHTLLYVRNICKLSFNTIEGIEACSAKSWLAQEHNPERNLEGGGIMTVIRANHLEKSAVNMSCVWGPSYPALEGENAGKPFSATGVSLISHPRNPYAPIMHLNIRCIQVKDGNKVTTWIAGGADLTPMHNFEEDTVLFHDAMKKVCERNSNIANYEKYKKWADEYFYIPHRKEARGVGGIFFDFVKIENEHDFSLLLDVGQYAAKAYAEILSRRIELPYDEELAEKHLYWRGRYAEFNLVYDRGTRFGLMTGGNHEAIFCSLPPRVKW
ncbi:coproporphyrinogen III oxidase [Fluviispira multicolorata]|uniref:coproporphyrinogen III oxidase n=1 Tax=Fluviispira multicolorata TaxID=2654512 RepID=UPI001375CEF8|nr:coproporphyrinogen III oxidase [Fluviispira multicolorata]